MCARGLSCWGRLLLVVVVGANRASADDNGADAEFGALGACCARGACTEAGVCEPPYFQTCNNDLGCYCFKSAEGGPACSRDFFCDLQQDCPNGASDCPPGEVCLVETCCLEPKCAPAGCAAAGALAAARRGGDVASGRASRDHQVAGFILPSGQCMDMTDGECIFFGGVFQGVGTLCADDPCSPREACCVPDGSCQIVDPNVCDSSGGASGGPQSTCLGDDDGDGVDAACGDECPDDPEKVVPGFCGCGVADLDSDADTVPDCLDRCPTADDRRDADTDGVPDCLLGAARIPTVSLWGLTVLALALLIAAKTRFGGAAGRSLRDSSTRDERSSPTAG